MVPLNTQVVAAEARSKELQEELTATYKEKSRLAEELVQASRQLQIVRDSNEAQVIQYPISCYFPTTCKAAGAATSGFSHGLTESCRRPLICM